MAIFTDINSLPVFRNAVITIGTFDGVHLGHKVILDEVVKHAADMNGESILLTFEPHPRKLLFPDQPLKLLTPLEEKIALITATGIQHVVVVPFTKEFASLSADAYIKDFLVKKFEPACIVIGYDHHFGSDRKGNIEMLKAYAGDYHYKLYEIPAQLIDEAAVSSTKVRNAVTEGRIADANAMLGRDYSLAGKVVKGAQLGKTLGFPTANLVPIDPEQLVPANGVYAVRVKYNEAWYDAMLNIGIRPTVSKDLQLHIEAHLFDFSSDLYDQELELAFVERLRDEQKFPSIDALREQLVRDAETAKTALR